MCGDVALNPGPVKHPCALCSLAVKSNQRALLCDNCELWSHCACCGITKAQYCLYQQQEEFSWLCPHCLTASLPFHDCSVLSSMEDFELSNSSFSEEYSVFVNPPTTTHSFLCLAHLNCRSLLCKLDEVLSFCHSNQVDVMALTETWLDDTVTDIEVCPCDHNLSVVRRDRNRRGGGVAILLSNHIRFCVHQDLSEGHIESLWIELFPNTKRAVLLCCVYRSPSDYHFYDYLIMECEKALLRSCQKLIIIGDLNSDMSQISSQIAKSLLSFMNQFHLCELVQSPTHITATTSSQLDLILTNIPSSFQNTVAIPCSVSDHHIVLTYYCARGISRSPGHKVVYSRRYNKLDTCTLERALLDDTWMEIFDQYDVNVSTEVFAIVMKFLLDALVPRKRIRVKQPSNPWSRDSEIATARRHRDWLHRRALKSGLAEDWAVYKKCRNKVTTMVRLARQQYLSDLSGNLSHDSHKFWRSFQHLSSRQKASVTTLDISCDTINQHFLTVAEKTVADLPSSSVSPLSYICYADVPDLVFSEVHMDDVLQCIQALDIHKAVGIDEIPTRFVKAAPCGMATILTRLI